MNERPFSRGEKHDYSWPMVAVFALIHLAPLGVFLTDEPVTAGHWALCIGLYFGRMFFVTAGYHRYFAHRSFKTSRPFQFLLALGATTSAQTGPLWWAAHHRWHHRYSDQPEDVHSPKDGFLWSHVGWIFSKRYGDTEWSLVKDLSGYPELRWLERWEKVPPIALAALIFVLGGWNALLIGFCLSTVFLWHGTFLVNSLAHVFGRRRYETTDTSKNSLLIALVTMGEGWHNNHHHYPASTRQGFFWWEVDASYYVLRGLEKLGLVRDLKAPPRAVLEGTKGTGARRPAAKAPASASLETLETGTEAPVEVGAA